MPSGTVTPWAGLEGLQSPAATALAGLFVLLLVAATYSDVRFRRIPNALNVMLLVGGVTLAFVDPIRAKGPVDAMAGVATGLGIWLLFYVVGVLGAGDVKFFAAASAWLGPDLSWRAALLTALVGGVLALGFLARDSRLGAALRSVALSPLLRALPKFDAVETMSPEVARRQLPYGVAMAVGAAVAFWFPQLVGG